MGDRGFGGACSSSVRSFSVNGSSSSEAVLDPDFERDRERDRPRFPCSFAVVSYSSPSSSSSSRKTCVSSSPSTVS